MSEFQFSVDENEVHHNEQSTGRSGLEPELGGLEDDFGHRSGFEPALGGVLVQKGVYVDETTCIGCRYCSHVARNTFYIEPDYGRSRVIRQDADSEDIIQEAIDTCPVDCIHWVSYEELKVLEDDRQYQVLQSVGLPCDPSIQTINRRKAKLNQLKNKYKG
jgi:ferredoxin